jgi:hypothetical protein
MNPNTDFAAALERSLAVLSNAAASAATLKLSAEDARGAVRGIDEANEAAPKRRAGVLANTKPLADMVASLEAIDGENRTRALQREVAVAVAAALDERVRDAAKTEAIRDEARKPFAAETKRANELAKRFAEYRALAERIVGLFRSDALVARFGSNAYSRVPARGSHVSFVRTFRLPRVLATPEHLTATRLLGFWPPKWNNFEGLEAPYRHDEEPDLVAGPVYELCQKSIISDGDIDRVVGRATALLVSEYSKACAAIRELLALDDQITAADRAVRYPDGGMIFDSALFPEHWHLGLMSKSINGYARIALPVIDGVAMAAE